MGLHFLKHQSVLFTFFFLNKFRRSVPILSIIHILLNDMQMTSSHALKNFRTALALYDGAMAL